MITISKILVILDHIYLFSQLKSYYTIKLPTHQISTDDIDIELSNVFTDYVKCMQHQNSQRADSIFANDVSSFIHGYIPSSELSKTQQDIQTPSQFINDELVETMPTTTQQRFFPFILHLQHLKIKIPYFHKRAYNPL